MDNHFQDVLRIHKPTGWDSIFFKEAILWRSRSHDLQTQCGCVLVKDKNPISIGYNGFIRDIDDSALPRTRPDKYPFMIHSEANAVYNAVRHGTSTMGSTAYITSAPCIACLQLLYQCGIERVKFTDVSNPHMTIFSPEYRKIFTLMDGKMELCYIPKELLSL